MAKVAMVLTVASCNTAVVEDVPAATDEFDDELLGLVRKSLGTKNVIPVALTFNTDGVRVFLRLSPGEDHQLRLGNTRSSSFSQPFKVCSECVCACACVRVRACYACVCV